MRLFSCQQGCKESNYPILVEWIDEGVEESPNFVSAVLNLIFKVNDQGRAGYYKLGYRKTNAANATEFNFGDPIMRLPFEFTEVT